MGDSIVESVLRTISDEEIIGESLLPWVKQLQEAINESIIELEIDSECLPLTATGKELKEAVKQLPASRQITILNDTVVSYGKRKRRNEDRRADEEHVQEMQVRQLKYNLMRYSGFIALFLFVVFTAAIIVISLSEKTMPNSEIANSLFTTIIEILKLIFAVT